MPTIETRPRIVIHYEDHCFAAPWSTPEVILMIHGIAESGRAWTQWVPPLSAQYRVLRPDLPGFGQSPTPLEYSWDADEIADDLSRFVDMLGVDRFHLVAAKYGGTVAMVLAARLGRRVRSLSLLGAPHKGDGVGAAPRMMRELGIAGWAGKTQRSRLGPEASEAQLRWWTDELMGRSDPRSCIGASSSRAGRSLIGELAAISTPTLVVTTEESDLQSVETARAYQEQIPNSKLMVLPGKAYHVAAVRPQECAVHVLNFISSAMR